MRSLPDLGGNQGRRDLLQGLCLHPVPAPSLCRSLSPPHSQALGTHPGTWQPLKVVIVARMA